MVRSAQWNPIQGDLIWLPPGDPLDRGVLADHLKNVDRSARQAKSIGHARTDLLGRVLDRIGALLGL